MKQLRKRVIAILLLALILVGSFSGCAIFGGNLGAPPPQVTPAPAATPIPIDVTVPRDGRLSVSFVPEDTLNPYTSRSRDNLAVSGLMHEGLWALDENFTTTPTLARGLATLDGRRYIIEIRDDITFHNGDRLTVSDVIYSLNRARTSALFENRLRIVSGYNRRYDAEGQALDFEMEVLFNRTHGNLPALFTFPIIQRGTSGQRVPPGTGPFRYPGDEDEGLPRLLRFDAHDYADYLPVDTIYLAEVVTIEQMTAHFNSGLLDILALDITTTGEPQLRGNRELRQYEASLIDFVGFNIRRPETGRLEVRRAISLAIDRAYITDNIMRGHAVASPLPLHPTLFYYDHALAAQFDFDLERARGILRGDTLLRPPSPWPGDDEVETPPPPPPPVEPLPEDDPSEEYPYDEADAPEAPERAPTQLTLLVAGGNTTRMEVAVYIAASISALGYQVIIEDLPYDQFMQALRAGNFDLFYGQVRLQPDFDLTEILFGNLSFGGMDTLINPRLVDDFLASGQTDRGLRASTMSAAILEEAPLVVIGFRNLAVATQRGVVAGMRPTQENIYHNVWNWIVDV